MEIELTDVERLAWEGLLREQGVAAEFVEEVVAARRALHGSPFPRVVALLVEVEALHRDEQTSRAKVVADAIAKAHGAEPPRVAPIFEPGPPAKLRWPDAPKAPDPASQTSEACPVVT